MSACICGCGEWPNSDSRFLPGHNQKLRAKIEHAVGGLEALNELVENHLGDC